MVAEDLVHPTLSFYSFLFLTLPSQKTQEGHTAPKATTLLKYAKTFTDLENLPGIIEYVLGSFHFLQTLSHIYLVLLASSISSTNLCLILLNNLTTALHVVLAPGEDMNVVF
jgi:hypothetical protein